MHTPSRVLILFSFFSVSFSMAAECADFSSLHADIRQISSRDSPNIDGILDEAIWQENSLGRLHQVSPSEFSPPSQKTNFWIYYDKDNLYIAAQMYSDDPADIVARQHIQGKSYESDDQLHISLDPFKQSRKGVFFQVNPNGIRREALISNTSSGFNAEWHTLWNAKSRINNQGWATEIVIPFKSLSFDKDIHNWGFNIGRVIRKTGEVLAWSSLGNDVWEMGPTAMGEIKGITQVNQGKGLELQLSASAHNRRDYKNKMESFEAEPSLSLFYKPIPELNFAASFNTDFSATEVDDRIVNLSRFNVLLPEKRSFFLQDANRYTFAELKGNGQPFISRSIGIGDEGQALDLIAGVKASGQINKLSFGTLALRQQASAEQSSDPDLLVFRASQNILKESSIGIIYTNGNPTGIEENQVAGIDFIYNNSNAIFNSQLRGLAWYQQSDSGQALGNEDAFGLQLAYPNATYDLQWKYTDIGENFNPAMGFVNRNDIRQHDVRGEFTQYFSKNWVQSYSPALRYLSTTNRRNELQSRNITLTPIKLNSRLNDLIQVSYTNNLEILNEEFQILPHIIVNTGRYSFDRYNLQINSSIARRIYAQTTWEQGDFYDGKSRDLNFTLGLRPVDRYLLQLSFSQTHLNMPTAKDKTQVLKLKHEFSINEDWAWLLLGQYDNITRQAGINSRFRWLPSPEKEFYFVINNTALRGQNGSFTSTETDYSIKLSFTYRS